MNRLQSPSVPNSSTVAADTVWGGGGVFHAPADDATHALFAPLHYEQNYAYPLLVWLHGGGDSERQLRRIMPLVSLRNYVAVAPRGTFEVSLRTGQESVPNASGYGWVQSTEQVCLAEQRVQQAIADAQRRFHIRPDRIFLAGFESGGTMAFRLGAQQATQFAGVVSLCGPFPTEGAPLARLNVVRELPLFVAACRQGSYYPTPQVCDNLRLFHSAGMSITLREYPGDDGLSPRMLADVDRWIMEQIVGPPALANVIPPWQTGVG